MTQQESELRAEVAELKRKLHHAESRLLDYQFVSPAVMRFALANSKGSELIDMRQAAHRLFANV